MGRRRGGRTLTPASLRGVIADEIGKAMTGAPRTAANPTTQAAGVSSTPDTFGQLAAMMRSMVGYQARPMARDPRDSGPFGPMHSMPPAAIAPARADSGRPEPWVYEYPVAWNIPGQGERLMPWRVLREAARNIDVIRRCIEIRKSRVKAAPWSWDISPAAIEDAYRTDRTKGHDDIAAELRDKFRPDINRLTEFWRNPWRANGLDFGQWSGGVMEGRLKYDAAVLYPRYNLGGDNLLGFEIIDATTIKPLLDYRGARPEPPFPAFQQILYGFPRGEWQASVTEVDNGDGTTSHMVESGFRSDQIEYLRDNYIENTPYGYGPTEQALIASRLWLRRQGWLLAEYTDGVTPAMIWELPLDATGGASLTPEQRVEWESSVNDELAGQTGERHRSKVGFPGMVPHLMPSVDERYKPEYDLFLLKLMCSFFGVPVSDLGFTETRGLGGSGMHASQAENRADVSTDPDLLFLGGLVNRLGHQHQAAPVELLFSFTGNDGGQDESQAATIRVGELGSGQKTLNDSRRELSLPPYPFPEADMPYVLGQAGPVFIEGALAASRRAQGLDAAGKPLPAGEAPGEQPPAPPGAQAGDNPGDKPAPGKGSAADKAAGTAPPLCRAIRDQLRPDYPDDATTWVKDANWTGPVDVPPNRLDLDDVKSWDAYGDKAKVDKFRGLMQRSGALKPIVAVTVPGDDRVKVVDGHHRALAAVREGLPVRAYVGAVGAKTGPWTSMHAKQHAGGSHGEVDGVAPVSAPPAVSTAKAAVPHEPSADARAEIAAYHRWANKATTGGRAFRIEHAVPEDFGPDGVPAGVEFDHWVWLGWGGDALVKAYEAWWPRDPHTGKWIARGHLRGLEDKIRELHAHHATEHGKAETRLAQHRGNLHKAQQHLSEVEQRLGGDPRDHKFHHEYIAAATAVRTHSSAIDVDEVKRDEHLKGMRTAAATVVARDEARRAKEAKGAEADAKRAEALAQAHERHVRAAKDIVAMAGDGGIDVKPLHGAVMIRSNAGRDGATRAIDDALKRGDLVRREGKIYTVAPAPHGPARDLAADHVQQITDAYHRLVPQSEWGTHVPLADLREALPHLTREQFDDAAKRMARTDRNSRILPFDRPLFNGKPLSQRQTDAAIRFGGADAHAMHIDHDGESPPSMTRPQVGGPSSDVVGAKLRGVTSTAEARDYLDALRLDRRSYARVVKDLDVPVRSGATKGEMRDALVELLAGRRLAADAITRHSSRDKAAGGDDPGKAPAPEPGAPVPPPDDRWPGWTVDAAVAAAAATALTAALIRGVDTRAVARAAADHWPAGTVPTVAAVRAWLRAQYGDEIATTLRPAVEDALTEGYLIGARSAAAVLDSGADPRDSGISLTVDWSHWVPGDARAARQVLSAAGRTVGLEALLRAAGVTIQGIAAQRVDELAAVLADGLERGASPGEIATALRGIVANPSWANTVAWTETARAQGAAASEVYRQRGVARNEWMTAHDQRVCVRCAANEAAGPVDVGTAFPSGETYPPGHPRCRCALIPTLDDLVKMVRAELVKRYNSAEPRDPHSGKWIGDGSALSGLADELSKLSREDAQTRLASMKRDQLVALAAHLGEKRTSGTKPVFVGRITDRTHGDGAPAVKPAKKAPAKPRKSRAKVKQPGPDKPTAPGYVGPRYELPPGVDPVDVEKLREAVRRDEDDRHLAHAGSLRRRVDEGDPTQQLVDRVGYGAATRVGWEETERDYLDQLIKRSRPEKEDPLADLDPVTPAEMGDAQRLLAERFRADLTGKKIKVRTTSAGLGKLLSDGRFKSQFETGKSKGLYAPTKRAEVEQAMFGLPSDVDPTVRPIYGYVQMDETPSSLDSYGDVEVVLKDHVRSRTTASVGDSLDFGLLPTPIDDPSWESTNPRVHLKLGQTPPYGAWYVEAQVHNGVTTDDIEKVRLPREPNARVAAALKRRGIPWEVIGG